VQVSDDPDFKESVRTLFNNDFDRSSNLGAGTDHEYVENYEGKLIDAKGVDGRYMRSTPRAAPKARSTNIPKSKFTDVLRREPGRPAQSPGL
jgi:hypothetical protein